VFTDRNSIAAALGIVSGQTLADTDRGIIVAAVIVAQALDRFTERIDLLIAEAKKPDSALR
jgi:hypothetical protein